MNNPLLPLHIAVWNQCFGAHKEWEIDCDGRLIKRSDYGSKSAYRWEIDHVWELALGGPDVLSNMRPRHTRGNRSAGASLGNEIANAFHVPSRNTPIGNMLATAPTPHSARGLEAVANMLAAPAPHSARGLADAIAKPVNRPVGLFGGLANALAERSRAAEEPPVNALYSKPRGLF